MLVSYNNWITVRASVIIYSAYFNKCSFFNVYIIVWGNRSSLSLIPQRREKIYIYIMDLFSAIGLSIEDGDSVLYFCKTTEEVSP